MFFNSFAGLPEKLLRKMWDDVWKCIYCGSDEITRYASPMTDLVRSNYTLYKGVSCNTCGKKLPYLDERDYGISAKVWQRRSMEESALRAVWKRTPLWALDNGKEEE